MARGDEKYRAGLREAGRAPTGRTGEADLEVRLARYIDREFKRRDSASGTPARTIVTPARPSEVGAGTSTAPVANTNQITLKATAGEAIGGHRPVYVDENKQARTAKASDINSRNVLGITARSWNAGDEITIVALGPVTESGWIWTPNQPVFVGLNGELTQTFSSAWEYTQIVGYATKETELFANLNDSIQVAV